MHFQFRNVNDAFHNLVYAFNKVSIPGAISVRVDKTIDINPTVMVRKESRNGPVYMVEEPVLVTYMNPKERVLFNLARDANPFFHLYEALWMLAGRNDVAPLAYYNSKIADFSDDGKTFNGAYGYRWRKADYPTREQGYDPLVDQLDTIVNHLKADPTSRRAVLQMWNVEDDLLKIQSSKDVCCNLSVMFSLRRIWPEWDKPGEDTFLDMTVTNRSNDLIWGMLGANYVHFTILQEYLAARLRVEVGRYHHFSNNLHVYEWNWKPEEWLVEQNNYYPPPRAIVPLVFDIAAFEKELPEFVQQFSGEKQVEDLADHWDEPFFMNVAQPMLVAYACYKVKDFHGAFACIDGIEADDWRTVAGNWMRKRSKSHAESK